MLDVIGKTVTTELNLLFLSFDTIKTGLVFLISDPIVGSKSASQISRRLIIIFPAFEICC